MGQKDAADIHLLAKIHIEEKADHNRHLRHEYRDKRDVDMSDSVKRQDNVQRQRHNTLTHAENLSYGLSKLKQDEIVTLKQRQWIRQNSPELRELECKLRAAYTSKELQAQIAEKRAERQQEKILEEARYKVLQDAQVNEAQAKRRDAEELIRKKSEYLRQLQDQMIINENIKRHRYDEFLLEKKRIDDIQRRIQEEDERNAKESQYKKQITKQSMDAFKTARELWRQREKDRIEVETKKCADYNRFKEQMLVVRQQKRHHIQAERMRASELAGRDILTGQEQRRERDVILQALYEAELRELSEQRELDEVSRKLTAKRQVKLSLQHQMEEKREARMRDMEDDARVKQQLLDKMAAEEKLDQYSKEKRRLKMVELRRDAEAMMKARRQKRAEEMQEQRELETQANQQNAEWQKQIDEERLRMLQEHGRNLKGFLARGILRPDDPDFFQCD